MEYAVKRDNWCRHRTPFTDEHKTCKAGVDFHQFTGPMATMPCLGETPEAKARCPQYSAWTQEEIDAREKRFEEGMGRMAIIRHAIVESVKATKNRSGAIPCPACKAGTVHFSQAINGHIHAGCTTKDCASWME